MSLLQTCKNVYHFFQAHAWRVWYGFPDTGMHIYGITGTNGKTTTSHFLAEILTASVGKNRVGLLTTINIRIGEHEEVNETKLTTLPSKKVYATLAEMKRQGVTHVVLEITSHALHQHRLAGVRFDGGIITNIEREHLNYHNTMKEYVAAKLRILRYLKPHAPLVYKGDDAFLTKHVVLRAAVRPDVKRITFTREQAAGLDISMLGEVNKENALSAKLLAEAVGIPKAVIQTGIKGLKSVAGRMQEVPNSRGVRIIIDYAVTPAALERLYKDVKNTTQGSVFAVLGAAGLRDRGKRPDMARIVATYSDLVVITREDPWTEPEEQIFQDLEEGLRDKQNWKRIEDRREAISHVLSHAKSGDTVVITGKGAEMGMGIGKDVVSWNDTKVVLEILNGAS